MTWRAPRDGRPGRPAVFSDAAIQFCLSVKVLFKLPLRQTAGMVASLLRLAGLNWPVPDFSTLCRRQKTLAVQVPYRRADGPLNLLVDSTGIKFLDDGEWQARKHGVQGRVSSSLTSDSSLMDVKLLSGPSGSSTGAAHPSLSSAPLPPNSNATNGMLRKPMIITIVTPDHCRCLSDPVPDLFQNLDR